MFIRFKPRDKKIFLIQPNLIAYYYSYLVQTQTNKFKNYEKDNHINTCNLFFYDTIL